MLINGFQLSKIAYRFRVFGVNFKRRLSREPPLGDSTLNHRNAAAMPSQVCLLKLVLVFPSLCGVGLALQSREFWQNCDASFL